MNPNFLPDLQVSLRRLGEFAARHDVNDGTLADIAAELEQARALVTGARGVVRANRCVRHPGGPYDPGAANGCLLCGLGERRPATPAPEGVTSAQVLEVVQERGHEAAAAAFGPAALARALAAGTRTPAQAAERAEDGS